MTDSTPPFNTEDEAAEAADNGRNTGGKSYYRSPSPNAPAAAPTQDEIEALVGHLENIESTLRSGRFGQRDVWIKAVAIAASALRSRPLAEPTQGEIEAALQRIEAENNRARREFTNVSNNIISGALAEARAVLRSRPVPCKRCGGQGYLVMDAEWDAQAVQCPDCRPAPAEVTELDDETIAKAFSVTLIGDDLSWRQYLTNAKRFKAEIAKSAPAGKRATPSPDPAPDFTDYAQYNVENWDGAGATPITHETVEQARAIAELLTGQPLDAAPGADGSIGFEWVDSTNGRKVFLDIGPNSVISIYARIGEAHLQRRPAPDNRDAVPEGWQLVPIKPTPEIIEAMSRARSSDFDQEYFGEDEKDEVRGWVAYEYHVALAASPSPPSSDAEMCAVGVPEGWPTEAMIERGLVSIDAQSIGIADEAWIGPPTAYCEIDLRRVFRAMMAAAPPSDTQTEILRAVLAELKTSFEACEDLIPMAAKLGKPRWPVDGRLNVLAKLIESVEIALAASPSPPAMRTLDREEIARAISAGIQREMWRGGDTDGQSADHYRSAADAILALGPAIVPGSEGK